MKLEIQNIHKLIHTEYHNGRFLCTNAVETLTNYRFQFSDTNSLSARYLWVEISKLGIWDSERNSWIYPLNYPNMPSPSPHAAHLLWVTANWLGFPPNAVKLMEECLKPSNI